MGVVYRGERVKLGRPVAVKFLHPWIAAQKAFLGRFENEAKAMSRLAHPNCVSVIDFGIEGAPYLVMEFVTGKTLREVMRAGPLAPARALRIAQQLLAGLAHAHGQGIVHRDLKPENLILSGESAPGEHLRILDFGLAKLRDGPAMTAGLAVGTPSYMSPEQAGGSGAIDPRTDLYTVGVLLFEVLAGRKPFVSDNVGELILMHREAMPPRLRDVAPTAGLSAALEEVLDKALSKLPEDRFQSAAELAAALDETPEASGTGSPPGKRSAPAPAQTTVDTVSAVRRRLGKDLAPAPMDAGASVRTWRLAWLAGAFLLLALLALLIGRGLGQRSGVGHPTSAGAAAVAHPSPATATPALGAPPIAAPPASGEEDPRIEEARKLVAAKRPAEAIAVLERLRSDKPEDPDAPYLLALVDFDSQRWGEGLAAARVAFHQDPAVGADGDLVRAIIGSLASDRTYPQSQSFLRELGGRAKIFIEEAAARDPSPKVRERAAALLDGGGGRSRDRGWIGGHRLFKR